MKNEGIAPHGMEKWRKVIKIVIVQEQLNQPITVVSILSRNLSRSTSALLSYLTEERGTSCATPCLSAPFAKQVCLSATSLGQQYVWTDKQGVGHAVDLTPIYPTNLDFAF